MVERGRADDADAGGIPIHDPDAAIGRDGNAARRSADWDLARFRVGDGVENTDCVVILVDEPHARVLAAARLVRDVRRVARLRRRQRQVDRLHERLNRSARRDRR